MFTFQIINNTMFYAGDDMRKFGDFICKNRIVILIVFLVLLELHPIVINIVRIINILYINFFIIY